MGINDLIANGKLVVAFVRGEGGLNPDALDLVERDFGAWLQR
jgi:hypothetical protein